MRRAFVFFLAFFPFLPFLAASFTHYYFYEYGEIRVISLVVSFIPFPLFLLPSLIIFYESLSFALTARFPAITLLSFPPLCHYVIKGKRFKYIPLLSIALALSFSSSSFSSYHPSFYSVISLLVFSPYSRFCYSSYCYCFLSPPASLPLSLSPFVVLLPSPSLLPPPPQCFSPYLSYLKSNILPFTFPFTLHPLPRYVHTPFLSFLSFFISLSLLRH